MDLIQQLNWRYATKRMNGTQVPQEKVDRILEAIRLAPTSFGLQPFKVIVVTDPVLRQRIFDEACQQPQVTEGSHLLIFAATKNVTESQVQEYMQLIANTRGIEVENLAGFKAMFGGVVSGSEDKNFAWTARQAYIAFGVGIVAAAMEHVDATPMEGFSTSAMDEILGLAGENLSVVNMIALGYRHETLDTNAKSPKVRKSKELLFEFR